MNAGADEILAVLGLEPLAGEGGYFRRTAEIAAAVAGGRAAGSSIYYLLTRDDVSALHRLDADETWHHYAGDCVEHVQFDLAARQVRKARLGSDVRAGERPQVYVPRGTWQGARLAPGGAVGWALMGCTVTPAWVAAGFELAPAALLPVFFPAEVPLLRALTR